MIVLKKLHQTNRGGKFVDCRDSVPCWLSHLFIRDSSIVSHHQIHNILISIRIGIVIPIIMITAFILVSCDLSSPTAVATSTQKPTLSPTATITPITNPTPTEVFLRGTITLWHAWDDDDLQVLLQVIDDFKNTHPEVNFDVLYVPFDDLFSRYELSVVEGGGPAILIGPDRWGPRLFDSGNVVDLSNLVDDTWLESFNPAALEMVRYRQKFIGLPYLISGVVLYRNQNIIPTPAVTFNDFVFSARNASTGEVLGAVLERSFFYSGAHLFGLGGQLMDDKGQPVFNNERGLAWLDLLSSFENAGPTEFSSDNDLLLFMEYRVGYLVEGTWKREILGDSIGYDNLVIDPWPAYGDGQLSGFVLSRNLYLNPHVMGESYEAIWSFCQFFLSPKYQSQLSDLGHIPVLLDLEVEDPLTKQAMEALVSGKPYPAVPEMEIYATALENALRSVFFDGISPDIALNEASGIILESLSQSIDQ